MIHIFYPLSQARRNKAASALALRHSVRIGQCCLTHQAGHIMCVNVENDAFHVSKKEGEAGAHDAIKWAEREHLKSDSRSTSPRRLS